MPLRIIVFSPERISVDVAFSLPPECKRVMGKM
jgi:hypothetical protein